MTILTKLALGAVAVAAMGSTAMAADLMAPPPAAAAITSGDIWTGGYVGLEGTDLAGTPNFGEVTGVAGFNFLPAELFLIGLEGTVGYYAAVGGGSTGFDTSVSARAGFVAGPALFYGSIGEWYDITAGGSLQPFVGAGIEVAASDNVSIRGQAEYFTQSNSYELNAGVLFHFK